MAIKTVAKPAGQKAEYRFLKNDVSGRNFKAKHEIKENILKQPMIAVTVALADATGKAIVNAEGEIELFTHTHVFTQAELTDPKFNATSVLDKILSNTIENKERDLDARKQIDTMLQSW